MTTTIKINLTLTAQGISKFKKIPTFNNLLYPNQIEGLKEGKNELSVNMTVWGSLKRVCGYDALNMNVEKKIYPYT